MNDFEKKALQLYGSAIRNDWSDIDGRSVRDDLDTIANGIDTAEDLVAVLSNIGVCEHGWLYGCHTCKGGFGT